MQEPTLTKRPYGEWLAMCFQIYVNIPDKRLSQTAIELIGRDHIGRRVMAPGVTGGMDMPKIVAVNPAVCEAGVWREPTFNLKLARRAFPNVSFAEITDVERFRYDEINWTITMMIFPNRIKLITPMLEMAAASGIGSLKELFLLAGRKVQTKAGVDATVDHFLGPSPFFDETKQAGIPAAAPIFQLSERWNGPTVNLPLSEFRLVRDWVKTA